MQPNLRQSCSQDQQCQDQKQNQDQLSWEQHHDQDRQMKDKTNTHCSQ